ncbi:MAG: FAD:protein FMN transferase [Weeksellaceae bacterium]|nr:FAD:protein FMN transferase [Weeksellaceae bacterium]
MIRILLAVFIFTSFIACQSERKTTESTSQIQWVQGDAFGSTYAIQYVSTQDYGDSIGGILRDIDHVISTYSNQAMLYQLNNVQDTITSHRYLEELLTLSREYSKKTDGYFDPTVEPLMVLWGFSSTGVKHSPTDAEVKQTLEVLGLEKFNFNNGKFYKTNSNSKISFNAITGYINDVVAQYLESQGVQNYLVEIGGEIIAKGTKPDGSAWRVGIDKPEQSTAADRTLQGIVELKDLGLATSGNYRKFVTDSATGRNIVHTMDPKTGYPKESRLLSATILAKSAAEADAIATAVMAMGSDHADAFLNRTDYKAMLIFQAENGEHDVRLYNNFQWAE